MITLKERELIVKSLSEIKDMDSLLRSELTQTVKNVNTVWEVKMAMHQLMIALENLRDTTD
jgi:hypothetical protein